MKRDDLPQLESGALAWRLDPGPTASVEIWSEIPLSQALSSSTDLAPLLVFLPSGAATPYEVQREAEAWVLADCTAPLRLDLLFRSDRVIWTAQRALVLGTPDRLPEVKAAVQLFTRLESELRAIEHTAREGLRSAESDVTLTHAVKTSDLAQQARVGIMNDEFLERAQAEPDLYLLRWTARAGRIQRQSQPATAQFPGECTLANCLLNPQLGWATRFDVQFERTFDDDARHVIQCVGRRQRSSMSKPGACEQQKYKELTH